MTEHEPDIERLPTINKNPPTESGELFGKTDYTQRYLGENADFITHLLSEELSDSELTSVLLNIYEQRSKRTDPSTLLRNYKESRFVRPAEVDPLELRKVDIFLMQNLPHEFDLIELSPVTSINACSTLSNINPKTTLQTIRNLEVINDTSIVLALESAKRKVLDPRWGTKERRNIEPVYLANSHRELRTQEFTQKHLSQHFSSFTLTSADRDPGRQGFEKFSLNKHLSYWIMNLETLDSLGYDIKNIQVFLSHINVIEGIIEENLLARTDVIENTRRGNPHFYENPDIDLPPKIENIEEVQYDGTNKKIRKGISTLKNLEKQYITLLRDTFPNVTFSYDLLRPAGIGYYNGLCYKIKAENKDGDIRSIIDGGASDWMQKLTFDKREKFFGSGLGLEILIKYFKD